MFNPSASSCWVQYQSTTFKQAVNMTIKSEESGRIDVIFQSTRSRFCSTCGKFLILAPAILLVAFYTLMPQYEFSAKYVTISNSEYRAQCVMQETYSTAGYANDSNITVRITYQIIITHCKI
jgi:TRAP-type mannitol/chloroaromatic compound transport system permease small subunit